MRLSRRSSASLGLALLGLVIVLVGGARSAAAYPQFQFSTYASTCSMCHFSPTGGGLINGFGRSEAGETISRGGNGELLNGLWTPSKFLALGVDMRGAVAIKDNATEPQILAFPMQADVYARVAVSGISVNVTVGMRGAARGVPAPRGEKRTPLDRLVSREHYLMYETGHWYARAGRYHAPYGLRSQDHSEYIRRYLGQHTLEETYNASAGYITGEYEWHATLSGPAPVLLFSGNDALEHAPVGSDGFGGSFYYENRNDDQTGAFGVQARADVREALSRYWVGGLYKRFYEDQKLMLLSQLDVGVGTFDSSIDADPMLLLSAHLGLTYFLTRGVMLNAVVERYDPDVLLSSRARDAASLAVQYFPWAHLELHLLGRLEFQGEDYAAPVPVGLLMVHYYM